MSLNNNAEGILQKYPTHVRFASSGQSCRRGHGQPKHGVDLFTHAMRTQVTLLWLVVTVLDVRVGAATMPLQALLLCARET